MATVELLFSALPEHVRTARLVAAAVARRAGVDEAVLDEVRLAVGEACTRAVGLHMSNGVDSPVRVSLIEDEKKFSIEVGDEAPHPRFTMPGDTLGAPPGSGNGSGPAAGSGSGDGIVEAEGALMPGARDEIPEPVAEEDEGDGEMGLAVISGLVDDVEVSADENGGVIRMSWPTTPEPVLP
ncbi:MULTISPECIES: ATP-binding protein [unclassified Streptomyces]|uniref:ATP-binding protein n=1 Tax=unclassified Streptomyces TaxID=2593676 RepID=UPI002DD8EA46|nr:MULTISPECIES: ATP-binding protein [unclassified Streptomyces]WSA93266.1 ATP-binding protein [Streptomyces sp. NBC_01795]WSB77655.1 ATP-binding protein [Streptomyces sp. NBC_01775]WSS14095.1 ATP-binding protein [Streptomyces sp. NBC_01186]WSS42935.1 ATP-binding protein [Streptomyces sp. NBC_01187]